MRQSDSLRLMLDRPPVDDGDFELANDRFMNGIALDNTG